MEQEINQQPVVEVELGSLKLVGSPRLSGERPEHVHVLAAAQNPLPPIVVHRPTMRVIDGFHRLKAARLRGEDKIAVRFFDGEEAEAFVLAVQLNVTHGLPLALADRKRAAERITASHPQWSDRKVASVTGISPGTVGDIRRRIVREVESDVRRIGRDGRLRPVDGSVGRVLAGELLLQNPELSLRQVARAAGISPETARDVRNRLRNGEELLPKPRRRKQSGTGGDGGAGGTTERKGAGGAPGTTSADGDVVGRAEFGGLVLAQRPGRARGVSVRDRAALVSRLKADPALRFTDTGRNLLRLLALHSLRREEWDAIISNVPPHCGDIVADLARQFADLWSEFAVRVKEDMAQIG
ncbi:ParB N-terminal domain-containing protein [Streptomyces sp. NPDC059447]|uniref:ParB/RepB/Spo0J family partition protein n=1 Tax=Streptomyces sp. NPDC059447 TaxID=3346834 RepID=UPI00367E55CB